MNKIYFIRLSVIIIVILSVTFGYIKLKKIKLIKDSQPLNLIIISIDTLRADHMGIYGYNKDTTPNIDKWAKDANVFTNAVAVMPTTYSSFTTLMTGKHALSTEIANSVKSKPLDTDIRTLAQILKDNKYQTAAFFTNTSLIKQTTNLDKGFDIYSFNRSDGYAGDYNNPEYNRLFDNATEYIDKNKENKFFLWIHMMDPHAPYVPPYDKKCLFNKSYCSLINSKELKVWDSERKKISNCQQNGIPENLNTLYQTLYDGEIGQADQMTSVILNKLKSTGLDKNSIVVLYGDHGESFDHNYFFNHGTVLYQSSVNIPLIIKYPPLIYNNRIDRLVENTDIFPTILELLNIPSKDSTDGISFADSIFKKTIFSFLDKKREYSYLLNTYLDRFAIFDGRYKYIRSSDNSLCINNNNKEELYDLKIDRSEEDNLILKKEVIKNKLKNKLLEKLTNSKSHIEKMLSNIAGSQTIDEHLEKLKSLGY